MKPRCAMLACLLVLMIWTAGFCQAITPLAQFTVPTAMGTAGAVVIQSADGRLLLVVSGPPAMAMYVITPLGATPTPPSPGPAPQPDPLSGLAVLARDWVSGVGDYAERKSDLAALVKSFQAVASQIAAGTLKTPEEIVKATSEANANALAGRRDKWLPWAQKLRDYLNAESVSGRLKSADQYRSAWIEISKGLEAVK